MRRFLCFALAIGALACLSASPAQASTTPGTKTTFTNVMRIDNADINWWNGLLKSNGGRHTWAQWANAAAPIAQDDAKIATKLLAHSWPRRVRSDVMTVVTAKINEGAAWAAYTKACLNRNKQQQTLTSRRITKWNVQSHRAENRVRTAYGLKPL